MEWIEKAEDMFKKGLSLTKIGENLGVNRKLVSFELKKRGHVIKYKGIGSNYDKYLIYDQGEAMFIDGKSIKSIAKTLQIGQQGFSDWLKKRGHTVKPSISRDWGNKEERLLKAEKYYNEGMSLRDASRKASTSSSSLSDFLKDKGYSIASGNLIYELDDSVFDLIDAEEKAYWLGFLYADGYVSKDFRNEVELALSTKDKDHIVKFQAFLKTNSPVKDRLVKLNGKDYPSSRLLVVSKRLKNSLIAKGCSPQKSLNLIFPDNSIVPDDLLKHFVRGYFDGDGSLFIRDDNQAVIQILGTKEFLVSIREKFNLSDTKFQMHGKAYGTSHVGNNNVKKFLDIIYKDASIYLGRKYHIYKTHFSN